MKYPAITQEMKKPRLTSKETLLLDMAHVKLTEEQKQKNREVRMSEKYEKSHKVIDGIEYKLCSMCEQWKICTLEFFYANKSNKSDGLNPYCIPCTGKKNLQWQYDNYDRWKAIVSKNDKTERKRKLHREVERKRRGEGKSKEWYENNKDKHKEMMQKRENKLSEFRKPTSSEWKYIKKYFYNTCAYCGLTEERHRIDFDQQLHKEHIIDIHNDSSPKGLDNLIPSCKTCNSSKHDRDMEEWFQERDFFSKERLEKIYEYQKHIVVKFPD